MDFIIYTFGGGDILWHVFNGMARVFASDSAYFTPVGKLALTIGGIWAGTTTIYKGNVGMFAKEWFFPSFFLFIFMFAPKANVWLKDEVTMTMRKIDNIPAGIAIFTSVSSKMSYLISQMLEEQLRSTDASAGDYPSSNSGIMFGAKALGKVQDVQIQNPITLTNSKEFLRQCFTKPYIIGNIAGKKALAQQSNDIINFIETNIPNNFGIYYRDPKNSSISFKTCKEATPLIKASIAEELTPGLLTKFASAIGMQSSDTSKLESRLKAMTGDTLKFLKQDQNDIHQWMKQAMLLNANRESLDDWRENLSMNRLYPHLVSMNATRGMFQQSFSYLVAGEMAANIMPILQGTFTALIACLIFIIFPMSMLPGGYKLFKTWVMLLLWVGSWPVFFTVIHCLGMLSLAGKTSGFGDSGMSILSQGGFSEMTLNTYSTFQMLAASVPMLSWAVLKGCAHATTTLAGQFSPVSVASGIGSNIADNNITMDNHNIGNRTISQQNLAPSLLMGGGTIDDGGMRVVTTDSGRQLITENTDNLSTNFNWSEMASDSIRNQYSDALSKTNSISSRMSSMQAHDQRNAVALGSRFAHSDSMITGLSFSENQAIKEAISRGESVNNSYSDSYKKDTTSGNDLSLGLTFGGTGAAAKAGATNTSSKGHELSASEQQAYNQAIEKVQTAARENRINSSDESVKSLSQDMSASWSEQQSLSQELAHNEQAAKTLQNELAYLESSSGSINANKNEEVLQRIIDTQDGVYTKEQAARWISSHKGEAGKIAWGVIKPHNNIGNSGHSLSHINDKVNNTKMITAGELKANYNKSAGSLESTGLASDVQSSIDKGKKTLNNTTQMSDLSNDKNKIKNARRSMKKHHDNTPNSTLIRMADQLNDNIGLSSKAIQKRGIKPPGKKSE